MLNVRVVFIVIGKDNVGIVVGVSNKLVELNINIVDVF